MRVEVPERLWPLVAGAAKTSWPPRTPAETQAFIARCNEEGLLPILFETATPELRSGLEGWRALLAANRHRTKTIAATIASLPELTGREVALIKGSDLAFRIYPAPELRPMGDVDVLARREDLQGIVERLESRGCTRRRWRLTHFAADNPDYTFDTGSVTLEVHHGIVHPAMTRIDYREVWANRQPTAMPGIFRLSDADALMAVALNISKDGLEAPLFRYLDVWLILRSQPQLYHQAMERAKRWNVRNALHVAFSIVHDLFPDVPIDLDRRPFLDRFVARPNAKGLRDDTLSRWTRMWRKYWLIDDLRLRARYAAKITAAAAQGLFRRSELAPKRERRSPKTTRS